MDESINIFDNSPTWRWDIVRAMVHENRTPGRLPEDELFRRGVRLLKRWKASSEFEIPQIKRDYPDLLPAFMMFINPRSERWIIEAGLLSNATYKEVAAFIARPEDVVKAYAEMFYDVAERKTSRGYILNQILVPSVTHGMHGRDFDFMFKTLAYAAGWQVFTDFIDDKELCGESRKFLETNFNDRMLKLGYIASHRIEVSNYNASEIIGHCLQIRQLEVAKGSPLATNEAWHAMNILLQKCVTTIVAEERPMLDEPRVIEGNLLTYGQPIPVVQG